MQPAANGQTGDSELSAIRYVPGDDVGALEIWPFDNPASQYRIVAGSPSASGRLDAGGGAGDVTRAGIWRCTPGTFECIEQGDEMMTMLSGACRLTFHATGATYDLMSGDSLFIPGDSRVTWEISATVTKVFFGFKADGYR
ncbi:MAG: cupin domain-containing protein [Pseudomonadota bacterium]